MLDKIIGHEKIIENLIKIKKNPPKVLLFAGPKGVGKKFTAFNFIDEMYEGTIGNRLDKLPDINFFKSDTKTFKLELVDQIRKSLSTTPFEMDRKFYILRDVDKMNKESANACLKIFEDCPKFSHFILLAENTDNVLDTILSRSIIYFFNPIADIGSHFPVLSELQIRLMGGCIGKKDIVESVDTDELYNNVFNFVSKIDKMSYGQILEWYSYRKDLNKSILADLMSIACLDYVKKNNSHMVMGLMRNINDFKNKIPMNLNLDMHLKNALIQTKFQNLKVN